MDFKKTMGCIRKKVADLEKQVQSQPLERISALNGTRNEHMKGI